MNSVDLLMKYKGLISFDDKMEKDNFKYISSWVNKKSLTEEEKVEIISDVIDIHNRYLSFKHSNYNIS